MNNIFDLIDNIGIDTYNIFEERNEIQFSSNTFIININNFETLLNFVKSSDFQYLMVSTEINPFVSYYFSYPNSDTDIEDIIDKLNSLKKNESKNYTVIKITLDIDEYKEYLKSLNPSIADIKLHIYYEKTFDDIFNLDFIVNNSYIDLSKHNLFYFNNDDSLFISNQVLTVTSSIDKILEYQSNDFLYTDYYKSLDNVFQLNSKLPKILPPYYFIYDEQTNANDNQIIQLNHLKAASIISFFACTSEFNEMEHTLLCSFSTYKHDSIKVSQNIDLENFSDSEDKDNSIIFDKKTKTLSKIFEFMMERDSATKLNIIKNIIGLHISENSDKNYLMIIAISDTVLNSLKSNYLIYSKEKIQYWFDERRKTTDYINIKCNEITAQIDNISSIASKALTSTLAVFIGGIIPYTTSNNIDILGPILILFRWIIPIFMYFYIRNVNEQFNNTILDYEHFITIESDFLHKDEIDKIVGDQIDRRKTEYQAVKNVTIILCIAIVVAVYYASENYSDILSNYIH